MFATPDGEPGEADRRMVTGEGLGLLAPVLSLRVGIGRGSGAASIVGAGGSRSAGVGRSSASSTEIKPLSTSGKVSRRAKLRARICNIRRG